MHKGQIGSTFKCHRTIIIHYFNVQHILAMSQFSKTLPINSKALRMYSLEAGPVLKSLLIWFVRRDKLNQSCKGLLCTLPSEMQVVFWMQLSVHKELTESYFIL